MNPKNKVHIGINTAHFDKSVEFYEALFGQPPTKQRSGYAKFDLANPPVNFTVNQSAKVTGNRLNHMGIQVTTSSEVSEQTERLKRLGLSTRVEKGVDCCYAIQDKTWVKDPDGNAWEVFVVLKDSEKQHGKKGCC